MKRVWKEHKVIRIKKAQDRSRVCVCAGGNISISTCGCLSIFIFTTTIGGQIHRHRRESCYCTMLIILISSQPPLLHMQAHMWRERERERLNIFECQTAISPCNSITPWRSHKTFCSSSLQFALIWYTNGKRCKYICNNVHTLQQKKEEQGNEFIYAHATN